MDYSQPQMDLASSQTDWNQPHTDWAQTGLSHDNLAMPRSAVDAANASGWADWHQKNADKATDWANWSAEHSPDNLTHHLNEAAKEQANANAKRQEALDELNK
jgi:hypothetical protein